MSDTKLHDSRKTPPGELSHRIHRGKVILRRNGVFFPIPLKEWAAFAQSIKEIRP